MTKRPLHETGSILCVDHNGVVGRIIDANSRHGGESKTKCNHVGSLRDGSMSVHSLLTKRGPTLIPIEQYQDDIEDKGSSWGLYRPVKPLKEPVKASIRWTR